MKQAKPSDAKQSKAWGSSSRVWHITRYFEIEAEVEADVNLNHLHVTTRGGHEIVNK